MANVPRNTGRTFHKPRIIADGSGRIEIVFHDAGQWISGPMLSDDAPLRVRLNLSDDAKIAAAMRVACTAHDVPVGTACPLIQSGACLTRLADALGDDL